MKRSRSRKQPVNNPIPYPYGYPIPLPCPYQQFESGSQIQPSVQYGSGVRRQPSRFEPSFEANIQIQPSVQFESDARRQPSRLESAFESDFQTQPNVQFQPSQFESSFESNFQIQPSVQFSVQAQPSSSQVVSRPHVESSQHQSLSQFQTSSQLQFRPQVIPSVSLSRHEPSPQLQAQPEFQYRQPEYSSCIESQPLPRLEPSPWLNFHPEFQQRQHQNSSCIESRPLPPPLQPCPQIQRAQSAIPSIPEQSRLQQPTPHSQNPAQYQRQPFCQFNSGRSESNQVPPCDFSSSNVHFRSEFEQPCPQLQTNSYSQPLQHQSPVPSQTISQIQTCQTCQTRPSVQCIPSFTVPCVQPCPYQPVAQTTSQTKTRRKNKTSGLVKPSSTASSRKPRKISQTQNRRKTKTSGLIAPSSTVTSAQPLQYQYPSAQMTPQIQNYRQNTPSGQYMPASNAFCAQPRQHQYPSAQTTPQIQNKYSGLVAPSSTVTSAQPLQHQYRLVQTTPQIQNYRQPSTQYMPASNASCAQPLQHQYPSAQTTPQIQNYRQNSGLVAPSSTVTSAQPLQHQYRSVQTTPQIQTYRQHTPSAQYIPVSNASCAQPLQHQSVQTTPQIQTDHLITPSGLVIPPSVGSGMQSFKQQSPPPLIKLQTLVSDVDIRPRSGRVMPPSGRVMPLSGRVMPPSGRVMPPSVGSCTQTFQQQSPLSLVKLDRIENHGDILPQPGLVSSPSVGSCKQPYQRQSTLSLQTTSRIQTSCNIEPPTLVIPSSNPNPLSDPNANVISASCSAANPLTMATEFGSDTDVDFETTLQSINLKSLSLQSTSETPDIVNSVTKCRGSHPQAGETALYKPARPPAAPQSPAAYSSYPTAPHGTAAPSSMRYAALHPQQSPYGAAVPYRENPYTVRSPVVDRERDRERERDRQSVEYVPPSQMRPRISLLPSTDYLSALPRNRIQQEPYRDLVVPASTPVQLELGPPVKKIRLSESKTDLQQPLRIDTHHEQIQPQPAQAYNPQVEAISPTLPSDGMQEDASFRSTKNDLLQQISKVDREITKSESQIQKLKKKQEELEEAASKPASNMEEEEIAQQPKHQSLAQKIYAENRKKAQKAHGLLEKLGQKVDLPLYNQPSDTVVYHDNKRKHNAFKLKLLEHLRCKHNERETREKCMTETYSRLVQQWHRKVEKVENSQKWKAKEAKNREFFEKVFPELRKQREDRERFNRVGARIKSEADLEEIVDGLQEQEMEDKKMHSYAVIPPMLLDANQRRISYVNNNGRIEDFATEYSDRQNINVWSKNEMDVFKEKFLQHPKNFGVIASYLDRKNVCDCVQYYYLSKHEENYKRLLRKTRQRTRSSRNPHANKVAASAAAAAGTSSGGVGSGDIMDSILNSASGVTTRLQREQLQKQEPSHAPLPPASPSDCDMTVAKESEPLSLPPPPVLTPPPPTQTTCMDIDDSLSKSLTNNNNSNNNNNLARWQNSIHQPDQTDEVECPDGSLSEVKIDSKKKERRKEEKKKKEEELGGETSDEDDMLDQQSDYSEENHHKTRSKHGRHKRKKSKKSKKAKKPKKSKKSKKSKEEDSD